MEVKKRKRCYCEMDFLLEFLSKKPSISDVNDESISLMSNWLAIYKFIRKTQLTLNISKQDFKKYLDVDKRLYWIVKKSTDGSFGLNYMADDYPDLRNNRFITINNDFLNAIYLTTLDDNECFDLSKQYGIIVLNNNIIRNSNCSHIFIDSGREFPSENIQGWNFISINEYYPYVNLCNSLLIIDNYLFCDNYNNEKNKITKTVNEKLEYNLKPILESLLPQSLSNGIIFKLYVLTQKDDNNPSNVNIKELIEDILSGEEGIRKELNVEIVIKYHNYEFHDRCILTNNLWISSGKGFDIFGENKNNEKPTTINIAFPFLQNGLLWCDGAYVKVMEKALNILEKPPVKPINYDPQIISKGFLDLSKFNNKVYSKNKRKKYGRK